MATTNDVDGDRNQTQTTESTSHLPEVAEKTEDRKDSANCIKKEESNVISYYKLFSFADSTDYVLMVIGAITAIGSGLASPLQTLIFGELVNAFGQNTDPGKVVHQVSMVALKYVYLALGSGISGFLQVVCWTVTGERQAARMRALYLKAILRQDVGFFDLESSTGEFVERMSGDTVIIQDAMGEKVGKFIQLASTFLGGFVIAFVKGWLLSLVLLSSIPLLVVSAACMTIFVTRLKSLSHTAYSKGGTVVEQTISSIRTVASFTGEKEAIDKYDRSLDEAYKSGVREGVVSGVGAGLFTLIMFSTYGLAAWFGAKMILEKGYNGGDILIVVLAIFTSSFSLGQASPCLNTFAAGKVAAFKMFQTFDRKSKIDPYDNNGQKLVDIKGDIELKAVSFSYPSRPEEQIFNGFSLSISGGTTAALVGQSGSGKSTVISLIERFYDPQEGQVLIDGINIKEFQLRWLRGKIGLVSQEPVLFTSSIRDNIVYGKDGATDDEIKAAINLANATGFIDKLPQGLDSMVGVHGTQLSGGQKQRIAIARAILKDPRILLLDEATSALDAESERTVQEALDRVMINRTTVIVAHRLSTIKNADIIAVIHKGMIVEKGSHLELLQEPEGAYAQLIRLQKISNEPEKEEVGDQDGPEIGSVSHKKSTQSINHGSSGSGKSSPDSISTAFVGPVDPEPSKGQSKVSLVRLAYLNKPEIPVLLLGSIAAVISGTTMPIFGVLLSRVIKIFFDPSHKLRKESEFWALMFLLLGFVGFTAAPLKTYFFGVAGCKLIRRVRLMCFKKVVQMDISWFDKTENSSGAVGARLSVDAASIRGLLGDTLSLLVQNMATAIAGLVISFSASWQLALIILFMLPLIGLKGYIQMKFLHGFSAESKKQFEEASQVAADAVGSIRTVASFCAEENVMELYEKKCKGPARTGIRQGLIDGLGFGMSMLLLYSVYAISFYAGAQFVAAGKMKFPQVFQVFLGLTFTAISISNSGSLAPDTRKAKAAAASVFALLDQKTKIDYTDDSGTTLEDVKGDIVFSHVSFKYPTRTDVQIFQDLCLNIQSGKTVALVGESGSGKSTVISLLQRFYDHESGQITLDGVEIQKLKVKWLRQQMGLVSQEPVLFNETIRANIAYGKAGLATETEIIAAAELANAHNFISGLQQGYETTVGERGIQLSGGQKQRVAIARAMIKSPKILLLDEATSALDAESEKVVQDALDRVMVERTTVVVAHRLSTIKGADVIAVVKNGVIAEKGNHEELIRIESGIYASLVALHTTSSAVAVAVAVAAE